MKFFNRKERRQQKLKTQLEETAHFLARTEADRFQAKLALNEQQFQTIKSKIDAAITFYHPSGSNKSLHAFVAAVKAIFVSARCVEEAYWQDVWIRTGRRSLGNYNLLKA